MRLGLGSYAYGWAVGVPDHPPAQPLSPVELLQRAADFQVPVVQFADNIPLHTLPKKDIDRVQSTADALRVGIELGTRGVDADHLRLYLRLAERLDAHVLRLVIDTADVQPSAEEAADLLRPLLPDFEAAGVVLAIENHDRFTSSDLRRLFERLDSPAVGLCLDTANSFGAGEGVRAVAEALAPWVANLHVKDYAVERLPHLMGFTIEGRPAGAGDLDIPWLLEHVHTYARPGTNAILELWPPPEPALDDTIAKEALWVETSVRYLQTLLPR